MKVLVCGGRDFVNKTLIFDTLDKLHKTKEIDMVISGGARGADTFAKEWARLRCIEVMVFKPDWKRLGKVAGFHRNIEMLMRLSSQDDMVVAFWDGNSKGTAHTITQAKSHCIETVVVNY